MRDRSLPKGRLARLSRVARVGARSGLSLLGDGDGRAAAQHALQLLGDLRGLAAKAGQMASYVDGLVPEPQREAYERVLAGLRAATATSSFAQIRQIVERELDGTLAAHFAEFEETPLASASIGQVHRARLHDGQRVAVKVQHPGIEAAFETDLASAGTLSSFADALVPRGMNVRAIHDEMAERLREELDYRLEASRQSRFASLFEDDPRIRVPRVIDSHTTGRVLTTELADGHDFSYATQASAAMRTQYAEVLWGFVFKAILVHGVFNADPHPGNYLFHEDGSITFLDFGSVQELDPPYWDSARAMHGAAIEGQEPAFRVAAARACQTRPGPYEDDLLSYLWRCFEPLQSTPYTMTRDYVADIVRSTQDLKRHLLDRRSNITPPPSGVILLNRLQFGFYSVLARLEVPVDYAGIDRALLAQTPG